MYILYVDDNEIVKSPTPFLVKETQWNLKIEINYSLPYY